MGIGDEGPRLATIRFGGNSAIVRPGEIQVGLPQLCGAPLAEVWRSVEPVQHDRAYGFDLAMTASRLFASRLMEETPEAGLERASEALYADLFRLLIETGFPHLLRAWNYFPEINEPDGPPQSGVEQGNLERYRAFTRGRFRAIERCEHFGFELAASTAIGTSKPGFLAYFLASREPGIQIENPRQLSAYRYPPDYGPRSPSFSRATLAPCAEQLYISGTASIVGHQTRHRDSVGDQLDETLNNLDALAAYAGERHGLGLTGARDLSLFKVYIRHAEDCPVLQLGLARRLGRSVTALFLKGDICRADLLLEIEGAYQAPG